MICVCVCVCVRFSRRRRGGVYTIYPLNIIICVCVWFVRRAWGVSCGAARNDNINLTYMHESLVRATLLMVCCNKIICFASSDDKSRKLNVFLMGFFFWQFFRAASRTRHI